MQADNAIFRLEAFIGDFMGAKDCQSVDELMTGVMNRVQVFVAEKRQLATGDKMA